MANGFVSEFRFESFKLTIKHEWVHRQRIRMSKKWFWSKNLFRPHYYKFVLILHSNMKWFFDPIDYNRWGRSWDLVPDFEIGYKITTYTGRKVELYSRACAIICTTLPKFGEQFRDPVETWGGVTSELAVNAFGIWKLCSLAMPGLRE